MRNSTQLKHPQCLRLAASHRWQRDLIPVPQMSDLNFCCLILSLIFSVRQNRGQIYHLGNPTCPAKYNVDEKIIGCQEKLGSNISDSSLLLRRPAPLFLSSVACWAVVYMKTWKIYGPPALVHMKKGQCGLLTHTDPSWLMIQECIRASGAFYFDVVVPGRWTENK